METTAYGKALERARTTVIALREALAKAKNDAERRVSALQRIVDGLQNENDALAGQVATLMPRAVNKADMRALDELETALAGPQTALNPRIARAVARGKKRN